MKQIGYKTFVGENLDSLKENDFITSEEGIIVYETPEDSLRNTDINEQKVIAVVEGIGAFNVFSDYYYDYENMRDFQTIKITRFLTEKEILERIQKINDLSAIRMISSYKLSEESKGIIRKKSNLLSDVIDYYQEGKKDAFEKREKAKVKIYGQNNNKGCQGK